MATPAPALENRDPVVSTTSPAPTQPSVGGGNPPPGASQHAVGTKGPANLADWKTRLENVLQRSEDSNTATELSNLLSPKLVNKLVGKSKGDCPFDDLFNELLFTALGDGKQTFAALFIDSQYFKWNHKYGEDQVTALHRAVENGQKKAAIKILQHYYDAVDECDKYGRTPLHQAAQQGSKDFTSLLLQHNANVDASDNQNITPLHVVAWNPDGVSTDRLVKTATELLDNGAEVNTRDVFGETPLHDAAKGGDYEVMKLLLQRGGDVECRNFEGQAPRDVLHTPVSPRILDLLQRPIDKWDSRGSHPIPTRPPRCWNSAPSEPSSEAGSKSTNDTRRDICGNFFANVRFFYRDQEFSWSWSVSIHDLLHDHDGGGTMKSLETQFVELVFNELETKNEIEKTKDEMEAKKDDIRGKIWKWIHLPANQMSWVTDLVWCLTVDGKGPVATEEQPQKRKEAWEFLERNIAQRRGVNPRSFVRVPHAGDMLKNVTDYTSETNQISSKTHAEISETSTSNRGAKLYQRESWRGKTKFPSDQKFSLVVPYIDFETEQYLQRHDEVHGQYKIDARRFRDMCELEHKSFYYNELSGLHKPQTLDESYYDMLPEEDLRIRDRDQVVFKWFMGVIHKEKQNYSRLTRPEPVTLPPTGGPTDMATQTELEAKLKSKTSSGTSRLEFGRDTMDARRLPRLVMVHQLWLWKLDKDTVITAFPDRYHQGVEDTLFDTIRQGGIESYTKPEQLIEDILFESVAFLEEFRYAGLGIHVLDIFESSIATRSHEETTYFKEFRDLVAKNKRLIHQQVDREISLIYEIKDIRDELHLILRIFETQRDIVKKFAGVFWPDEADDKMRRAFIDDCGIEHIIDRTMALDRHAQRSLEGLDYLVQMKQAQSSLGEAETAGRLNNFIMLFTLITVVFTPLSFMTSLFTIPFDFFPQNSDGEIRLESDWIARRLVAGEFASIGGIGIVIVVFYSVKWSLGRQVLEFFRPSELDASRLTGSHVRHRVISQVKDYKFRNKRKRRLDMMVNKENPPGAEV